MQADVRRFRPALLIALGAVLGAALVLGVPACHRNGAPAMVPYADFSDLVEQVSPSVVNISTVGVDPQPQEVAAQKPATPPDLDQAPDWFKKFYRDQEQQQNDEDQTDSSVESLGSGFVLWADGYILTNYHVVRDAKEIVVKLLDRREFVAKVTGYDERSDLALLHIDATGLPAARLGDSNKLRPGQWVLAIGAPFGFDYSVTAGIVSAKGRALDSEQYVPFIQTDVAINPGNSGGPLFNIAGEVIGINSQIYSQSGGYQGVSFSIPINVGEKVARQLKDKGKVTRGWLGVVVQPVTREMAGQYKMERAEGALVQRVLPGSPAAQAGLKTGDVILSFNGEVLPSSRELPPIVGAADPGALAKMQVIRDGRTVGINAQIGTLDDQDQDLAQEESPPRAAGPLGVTVKLLSGDDRKKLKTPSGGVLVEDVRTGPAATAGLRVGDVILQIAGQEVDSPERYTEVAGRLTPGQSVPMLVQRAGSPVFLSLDVPQAPKRQP